MWAGPSVALSRAGRRGVVNCDRPADEWGEGRATRRGQWPEDGGDTGTRGVAERGERGGCTTGDWKRVGARARAPGRVRRGGKNGPRSERGGGRAGAASRRAHLLTSHLLETEAHTHTHRNHGQQHRRHTPRRARPPGRPAGPGGLPVPRRLERGLLRHPAALHPHRGVSGRPGRALRAAGLRVLRQRENTPRAAGGGAGRLQPAHDQHVQGAGFLHRGGVGGSGEGAEGVRGRGRVGIQVSELGFVTAFTPDALRKKDFGYECPLVVQLLRVRGQRSQNDVTKKKDRASVGNSFGVSLFSGFILVRMESLDIDTHCLVLLGCCTYRLLMRF